MFIRGNYGSTLNHKIVLLNINKMAHKKILIGIITFIVMCNYANAQFGRAIQRGVERGIERSVEKKAEEVTSKAIDDAFNKSEHEQKNNEEDVKQATEQSETPQKSTKEGDANTTAVFDEIPEVSNTPYTPSESEFAFFAMKEGTEQWFVSKDAKGKITSQTRNKITSITGDKNAFAIAYESEMLDAKGNPENKENPGVLNFRIVIKDGEMYFDMKEMFSSMEGIENVQISGSAKKMPNTLTVGQTLPDASANVKVGFINCTATMTEGKCVAFENVSVEAGTFNCYKVSQKVNVTAMGSKNESNVLTWYAKGVGAVKTETYDKKGNLQSIQELKSHQ